MAPRTKVTKKAVLTRPKLTYKDMIKKSIQELNERNGSSRQALKKHLQSTYGLKAANFDALFNSALKKGVETGEFLQPKGSSGPVKLVRKGAQVAVPTKPKKAPASAPSKTAKKPVKSTKSTKSAATAAKKLLAKPKASKVVKPKTKSKTTTKKPAAKASLKAAAKPKTAARKPASKSRK